MAAEDIKRPPWEKVARWKLLTKALTVLRSELRDTGLPTTCVQRVYPSVDEARAHIISILDAADEDRQRRFAYGSYLNFRLSNIRGYLKRAALKVLQDEGMIRIETAVQSQFVSPPVRNTDDFCAASITPEEGATAAPVCIPRCDIAPAGVTINMQGASTAPEEGGIAVQISIAHHNDDPAGNVTMVQVVIPQGNGPPTINVTTTKKKRAAVTAPEGDRIKRIRTAGGH